MFMVAVLTAALGRAGFSGACAEHPASVSATAIASVRLEKRGGKKDLTIRTS
jgi:hypothetical protein